MAFFKMNYPSCHLHTFKLRSISYCFVIALCKLWVLASCLSWTYIADLFLDCLHFVFAVFHLGCGQTVFNIVNLFLMGFLFGIFLEYSLTELSWQSADTL